MEANNQNKKFVVYFEIFGIKKKYIVNNENVKSQLEAETYVKNVLIPSNLKIYKLNSENSSKEEKIFNKLNKSFEDLSKKMDKVFDEVGKIFKK